MNFRDNFKAVTVHFYHFTTLQLQELISSDSCHIFKHHFHKDNVLPLFLGHIILPNTSPPLAKAFEDPALQACSSSWLAPATAWPSACLWLLWHLPFSHHHPWPPISIWDTSGLLHSHGWLLAQASLSFIFHLFNLMFCSFSVKAPTHSTDNAHSHRLLSLNTDLLVPPLLCPHQKHYCFPLLGK